MKTNFISDTNFISLLEALKKDYDVYVPVKKDNQRFYKRYVDKDIDNMVIGEVRPFEPLKSFFLRGRQTVAEGFKPNLPGSDKKPFAIVGVKACDLKGFKIQDYVFSAQGGSASGGKGYDYQDPFYIKAREENLIISSDCTCAIATCFCLALNVTPFAKEDFDINLSNVRSGFLVKAGSKKGAELIEKYSYLFQEAKDEQVYERDNRRAKVIKEVEANIKENNVPHQDRYSGIIEKRYESNIWKDEAKTCVECGACNTICPTCHCFLLYDQKNNERMERFRIWDSCLIKDFARVAGGANPRKQLWMRLRNRFEKKFDFFPNVCGVYACTGCGRCISACPGKIDIRRVLRGLTENA